MVLITDSVAPESPRNVTAWPKTCTVSTGVVLKAVDVYIAYVGLQCSMCSSVFFSNAKIAFCTN